VSAVNDLEMLNDIAREIYGKSYSELCRKRREIVELELKLRRPDRLKMPSFGRLSG